VLLFGATSTAAPAPLQFNFGQFLGRIFGESIIFGHFFDASLMSQSNLDLNYCCYVVVPVEICTH
jgi:hypothetical protein